MNARKTHPRPAGQKIESLERLQKTLESDRKRGKKIVLCHGVFDLLHPGHILHLQAAKKLGDVLVVSVTPDHLVTKGPGRPAFPQRLRLETLAAIECVDHVVLNQWPTAVETILRLKPHVYAKGSDYADSSLDITGKINDEAAAIRKIGGSVAFTHEESFSSSNLINRFFSSYPPKTEEFLQNFRQRHTPEKIISLLKSLSDLKVLVVGESIVDQYCYTEPLGKSPKETMVATKFISEEHFAGGALATANHLAGFCKEVTLVTLLGESERQTEFIRSKLLPNVTLKSITTPDRPTIVKRRYLDPTFLRKMFEVQYMDDRPMEAPYEKKIADAVSSLLKKHDFTVVADYGHGMLTEKLRTWLCGSRTFLAVNAQTNSANMGFNPITKYARADFACIDDPELRLAARERHGEVKTLMASMQKTLKAPCFAVSRGPFGFLVSSKRDGLHETPALSNKIVDRTGAGDALFALTSPCVFKGYPSDVVGFIGNCAGALAVEIVCNREPVDPVILYKFITGILK